MHLKTNKAHKINFFGAIFFLFIIAQLQLNASNDTTNYTNKIDFIFNQIDNFNELQNYDSVDYYCAMGIVLSKSNNDLRNLFYYCNTCGQSSYLRGQYLKADSLFSLAINLFNNPNNTKVHTVGNKNLAFLLNNAAGTQAQLGNYQSSIALYIRSMKIREEIKMNPLGIASISTNIANLCLLNNKYSDAEKYYYDALKIFKENNNQEGKAMCYGNLGVLKKKQSDTSQALVYYSLALKEYELLNNITETTRINNNLGIIYLDKNENKQAGKYLLGALSNIDKVTDESLAASIYKNIGRYYFQINNFSKAQYFLNKSLVLAQSTGALVTITETHELLSQLYEATNQPWESLKNHKLFKSLSDSIFNKESNALISELQTKFETEQKEKEILKLNKEKAKQQLDILTKEKDLDEQRRVFFIILTLLFIIIIFIIFYIKINSLKQKQKKIELENTNFNIEKRLLRTQLNPHFIFNSLNTIQNFINSNNNQQASKYLLKFSELLRRILDSTRQQWVSLADEIITLKLILEMESIRFDSNFTYKIEAQTVIDTEEIEIPPMLVQPFIENALIHGLSTKKGDRKLDVNFNISDSYLICSITDNGVGRAESKKNKQHISNQRKSHGIDLVIERLNIVNSQQNTSGKVIITDLYNKNNIGTGTKVTIEIPYESY